MIAVRQACDWKDTLTVLQYLQERNPFSLDPSLWSISTGVHAHHTVNVDEAVAVSDLILNTTVSQFYMWRHLPPVHRICSKKVQGCYSCILWLWKYEYKRYDTSVTVKRKGWCNCDCFCKHDHHNEEGPVFGQSKEQAEIYFHAEYRTREEQLHNLPCTWGCWSFDCSEGCSICYHL